MTLYPVILAGGSGTRLWPLSREDQPKQFLPLLTEYSTFQEAIQRLEGTDTADPIVVCNETHRFLVLDQLRELDKKSMIVVLEPVGRNTAPALTLAALKLTEQVTDKENDPIILSMHADHMIRDRVSFQTAVLSAVHLAEEGRLVTFGVPPTVPATGYGYIKMGANITESIWEISKFIEKPNASLAEKFLGTGQYLWNSGLFMMKASVWLSHLKRSRPDIFSACSQAYVRGLEDGEFYRPNSAEFIECGSESIDYAVMESLFSDKGDSSLSAVVKLQAGWSDIGAWSTLWDERNHDVDGNVVQGDVLSQSTKNTLMIAQHRLIATIGLEDMVVVETADSVLVAKKGEVQGVRGIVQLLDLDNRTEHKSYPKVHRPWGTYEVLDSGKGFKVKKLILDPGGAISLQTHQHRSEHWVIISGEARVSRGEEEFILSASESTYIPAGEAHRLENPGLELLEIIEVQTGNYFGEDDIVRLKDKYNRD